jgi:hypothetical protein
MNEGLLDMGGVKKHLWLLVWEDFNQFQTHTSTRLCG